LTFKLEIGFVNHCLTGVGQKTSEITKIVRNEVGGGQIALKDYLPHLKLSQKFAKIMHSNIFFSKEIISSHKSNSREEDEELELQSNRYFDNIS
jgi:hypothetical protein